MPTSSSSIRPPSQKPASVEANPSWGKKAGLEGKEKWVSVKFVDKAEANTNAHGVRSYRFLNREYKVVWRDTGHDVSLHDRKVAQIAADKIRPSDMKEAILKDKSSGTTKPKQIEVHGDLLISPSAFDMARTVYDARGEAGFPDIHGEVRPTPDLSDILSETPIGAFSQTVAQRMEEVDMPSSLHDDLSHTLDYLKSAQKSMARAEEFAAKMEKGTLGQKDYAAMGHLLYEAKENFPLLLNYLAQMRERPGLTAKQTEVLDAVQTRIADMHMALANLMTLHSEHLPEAPPLSRNDRLNAHRLDVEGMENAVRLMAAREPKNAALSGTATHILSVLSAHKEAIGRVKADGSMENLELALSLPLMKKPSLRSNDVEALKSRFDAAFKKGTSPLPALHPRMTQKQMLSLFVTHELKRAGVKTQGGESLSSLFNRGRMQAMEQKPWPKIDHEIRSELDGKSQTFRSVIEPASHISKRLKDSYEGHGVVSSNRLSYKHAVNLASTKLYAEDGEVLYAGHRMGVLDPYNMGAKNLSQLSDGELEVMMQDLLVATGARKESAPQLVDRFRSSMIERRRISSLLRREGAKMQARDLAATMLVNAPDKLKRALQGETVDLPITCISLMTPDYLRRLGKSHKDEQTMLKTQRAALESLSAGGGALALQIRDRHGILKDVKVRARPRMMSFGVNAGALRSYSKLPRNREPFFRRLMGWGFSAKQNDPVLHDLLGKRGDILLGGEVAEAIQKSRSVIEQNSSHLQNLPADSPERRKILTLMEKESGKIAKLHQLGQQVKQIWRENSYREEGQDPYKMVSRLSALLYILDGSPVINCKSGKDRTGMHDSATKSLLATAELHGNVRAPDLPPDGQSRRIQTAFALHGGSLHMQRYNTGLPGYKTEGVPSLMKLMEKESVPIYRGGSKFVQS